MIFVHAAVEVIQRFLSVFTCFRVSVVISILFKAVQILFGNKEILRNTFYIVDALQFISMGDKQRVTRFANMSSVPATAEFLICFILSAYSAVMSVRFLFFHPLLSHFPGYTILRAL
jgi:hypothetical protein